MLRAMEIDRHDVRHEVNAGRWRLHGHQTVAMHTSDLSTEALRWRAIWEVGRRIAVLDGVSALQAQGLKNFNDDMIHISIPHGSRPYKVVGVRTHSVRSREDEILSVGVPRVRPHIAAVRAAHWSISGRQAALILCMVVQQGIVTPARLVKAAESVSARRHRRLVQQVVNDLSDGVQSLGELDFARLCRARNLPEPSRQVLRHGPRGRVYLDVRWEGLGLVVEIDGAQHRAGLAVMEDNLRQNSVTLGGDVVLRIDLVGLRVDPDAFMDQVCQAHVQLTLARGA